MSTLIGHAASETAEIAPEIHAAIAWILHAAQAQSSDPSIDGGFISWYDEEQQQPAYVYSEITGYMISLLCSLWQRTGNEALRTSAIQAGDWLLRTAHEPTGGFHCLYPLGSSRFAGKQHLIYAFDCGVILSGLVNLFRITGEAKYLAASVTVADWLTGIMQKPSGGFFPVYDPVGQAYPEHEHEWSLCSGAYHTKIALGLLNLYDITRAEKYRRAAIAACDYSLLFQQPDGRFVTFPVEGGTNLHPHCYAAEGLWVAGTYLERGDYLDASARATAWIWSLQSPDGLVPRHYHNGAATYSERVDILCQAVRLALIHRAEGRMLASVNTQVAALLPIIRRNQSQSSDQRAAGAFYFGRQSSGELTRHANSWVTQFAIQALMLDRDLRNGREPLFEPFEMV